MLITGRQVAFERLETSRTGGKRKNIRRTTEFLDLTFVEEARSSGDEPGTGGYQKTSIGGKDTQEEGKSEFRGNHG